MSKVIQLLSVLAVCVGSASCSWFGVIDVREAIFVGKPLWEADKFQTTSTLSTNAITFCEAVSRNKAAMQGNQMRFAKLAKQVLDEDIFILEYGDGNNRAETAEMTNVVEEFPPSLSKLKVTRTLFNAVIAEHERLGVVVRCINDKPVSPRKLTNDWLWPADFKDLEDALSKENWGSIQNNQRGSKHSYFLAGAGKSLDAKDLINAYLLAYYTGSYVDRFGHALAKPELNFPLKNEVVVAFTSILYDLLWDYVLYLVNQDELLIGDPIVYEQEKEKPKYINPENKEPTFAKFLVATEIARPKEKPVLPGVLEPVKSKETKDSKGLTKQEVCVIHYLSGLSGEASQGLAGLIVRSLGGANLGFVVGYGKFSIGDNQMLTKIIDASVERFSKRSADLLFSDILYNVTYKQSGANYVPDQPSKYPRIDMGWIADHLELARILKCFEKTN